VGAILALAVTPGSLDSQAAPVAYGLKEVLIRLSQSSKERDNHAIGQT
jgi:hypothetical protein